MTIRIRKAIASGIKVGDNTHHQLQSILPSSFKAMKSRVRSPVNPIPLLDADEVLDILSLFS